MSFFVIGILLIGVDWIQLKEIIQILIKLKPVQKYFRYLLKAEEENEQDETNTDRNSSMFSKEEEIR